MLDHEWGLLQREAELRELDGPRAAISTGLGHSFYLFLMPFTVRISVPDRHLRACEQSREDWTRLAYEHAYVHASRCPSPMRKTPRRPDLGDRSVFRL